MNKVFALLLFFVIYINCVSLIGAEIIKEDFLTKGYSREYWKKIEEKIRPYKKIKFLKVNESDIPIIEFKTEYTKYSEGTKKAASNNRRNFVMSLSGGGNVKKIKTSLESILSKGDNDFIFLRNLSLIRFSSDSGKLISLIKNISSITKINYVEELVSKDLFYDIPVGGNHEKSLSDKSISSYEANIYKPSDPLFYDQWSLYNDINSNADIGYLGYRKYVEENNYKYPYEEKPVVAIVDIGIYYDMPELENSVWINEGEIPNNGKDDDNNGYIDDYKGVDVGHPECTLDECIDLYKETHGTAMYSIIASETDNDIYMSGILPEDIKVLLISASGNYDNIDKYLEAYDYVLEMKKRGVNIVGVNMSFGAPPFIQAEYDIIKLMRGQDIVIMAATGNEGYNLQTIPNYPASYDLDNIIAVGSVNMRGNKSPNSNYGKDTDVYMPGDRILQQDYPEAIWPHYITGSGTSQASAIMTGVFGVAAYLYPECSAMELKDFILTKSVEKVGTYTEKRLFLRGNTYELYMSKLSSVDGVGLIENGRLHNDICR